MQTQAGREGLAAQQLERQGYATFYPRRIVTVRQARRLHEKRTSYFPGYIFVSLDLGADRWRPVNGTFGVRSLVMTGGRPSPLPAGFVDGLRAAADEEGVLTLERAFAPGDRVRMLTGPFADLLGVIDRLEGPDRVRVLMDLLSGSVPVVAKSRDIVLAP